MINLQYEERHLKLVAGSHYIPDARKASPLGEDAHFICTEKQVVGVADGVGRWAKHGIDAGKYARELMSHSETAVFAMGSESVNPRAVLAEAYRKTNAKGSSTACIIALKDKSLHAVNVGDSGFVVVRRGAVVYRCYPQRSPSGRPNQLGLHCDTLNSAHVMEIPVQSGDVVVAGTDGLFDNVFDDDIANWVFAGEAIGLSPEDMAIFIATVAREQSGRNVVATPYAEATRRSGTLSKTTRGKPDDVTVVVMFIIPSEPCPCIPPNLD